MCIRDSSSGSEAGTAVALAVPIATLVLMLSNILMMFVIPQVSCVMADRNAAKGNVKGVEHAHLLAVCTFLVPLSLLVAVSYYLGAPFIADIVKSIPAFITHGLEVATGTVSYTHLIVWFCCRNCVISSPLSFSFIT